MIYHDGEIIAHCTNYGCIPKKSVKPPFPHAAEDLSPKTLVYTAKEVDRLQPQYHGNWILEYPGDVFVVFDPTTDGSDILGAARTLEEAEAILNAPVNNHRVCAR